MGLGSPAQPATRVYVEESELGMARAPLTFLAYVSRIRCTPEDIAELVDRSKIRNAAVGLTGVLIHDSSHFLQLLEGPWPATADTLLRIVGDPRHSEVTILVREPTEVRLFSNWNLERMEFSARGSTLLDRLANLTSTESPDPATSLRLFALGLERAVSR